MDVRGIEGLTVGELVEEVKAGGRFVVFQACFGLLVTTVRRASAVYFVRQGESVAARGWWRSVVSALLGWWAVPWGPGQTIRCIRDNCRGGADVTAAVLRQLAEAEARGLGMTDFFQAPRMGGRPHAA